jgi:hypothetical protein
MKEDELLGGILIVIGTVTAGSGGLCTLSVWDPFSRAMGWGHGSAAGWLGIIWLAAGLFMLIGGIALIRGDR